MPEHIPRRWSKREMELLPELRRRLATEIATTGQFPEVVGDRCLVRFLRGHGHNIDKATEMYGKYLQWRKEHNVDAAREDIVHGGKRPRQFPYAEDFLIRTGNQVIMSAGMRDSLGNPIAVETYEYSPRAILAGRTIGMYTEYMIYCMEFKMLVVEQLSEIEERRYLEACNYNPPEKQNGYGVIYQVTILRDLAGMSMEFMGAESKALLKVSLDIAQNNYPEMLYKSHLINTGWVFSTVWYFVKGLLDTRTASKVTTTNSSSVVQALADEVPATSIPTFLNGKYDFSKEPDFVFDMSEFGPLHFFPIDGSKPSCFVEYWKMQNAPPPPAAAPEPPAPDSAVTTPPSGDVVIRGILRASSDVGFEHARRRSESFGELHKVRAVILDLDGTLLDTETLSARAIKSVLANTSIEGVSPEFTAELQLEIMGLPDKAWTELVVSRLGLERVFSPAELLSQWEAAMEETMSEVAILPGAVALIERLSELGVPLAIATSSNSKIVEVKKRAHPEIFEKISVIVCGNDAEVEKGKPEPDIFLAAAKRLSTSPGHCLVVEDSATGVKAAKAAAMRVCACVRPSGGGALAATSDAVTAYNQRITDQLSDTDSLIADLTHFEYVKFGLFASVTGAAAS